MKFSKYLDLAKEKKQLRSDAQLAKEIGVTRAAVSTIRAGGTVSEDTIFKVARMCSIAPERLLAEYKLSRPIKPENKRVWERIYQSVACGMLALPMAHQAPEIITNIGTLYIM